jgi:hypothetical protein
MLSTVSRVIRELVQRRRANRDVDDELQFHLEMEMEANIARGLAEATARQAVYVSSTVSFHCGA